MEQGAATLKRVHFELGGKNPVIVFADADLERALDAAVFMIYSLNGERCTSSSRLLVEAFIYEEFAEAFAERLAKRIKVGHPLDPETVIGPLIHPRHREKVPSIWRLAQAEGATVRGRRRQLDGPGGGYYVAPTLFTGARNRMRIAQEEIFGPVLTAIPFADEAEALALANDVHYGLTAYPWTRDIGRALRFARQLEAGMIWVNSENVRHLPTPFGGMKVIGHRPRRRRLFLRLLHGNEKRRLRHRQTCDPEARRLRETHSKRHARLGTSAEGERVGLYARIEKFDLEGAIRDRVRFCRIS